MSDDCQNRIPPVEHDWGWNPQGSAAACKKCTATRRMDGKIFYATRHFSYLIF
jgi:hypothetical protein